MAGRTYGSFSLLEFAPSPEKKIGRLYAASCVVSAELPCGPQRVCWKQCIAAVVCVHAHRWSVSTLPVKPLPHSLSHRHLCTTFLSCTSTPSTPKLQQVRKLPPERMPVVEESQAICVRMCTHDI